MSRWDGSSPSKAAVLDEAAVAAAAAITDWEHWEVTFASFSIAGPRETAADELEETTSTLLDEDNTTFTSFAGSSRVNR
jgi:hypothetical protein